MGLENLNLLKQLDMSNNSIDSLQPIADLVYLDILNIQNNNVENTDELFYIKNFHNLSIFNCLGNKICKSKDFEIKLFHVLKPTIKQLNCSKDNQYQEIQDKIIFMTNSPSPFPVEFENQKQQVKAKLEITKSLTIATKIGTEKAISKENSEE
ncbi:Conserved_hypothetical protein [Hexamita inflata]|uniref:Leucine rich repeat protein n=1 Tax=Hexamita inflata TaxID=28002 RepID=A0AA86Q373_9EUKA|nr:Conserved hypothetical protein [Hexamita inflata]